MCVSMYVCICVCLCLYICVCIFACICVCLYMCRYICVCVFVYRCVYIFVYLCVSEYVCVRVYMSVYMNLHNVSLCLCVCIYVCVFDMCVGLHLCVSFCVCVVHTLVSWCVRMNHCGRMSCCGDVPATLKAFNTHVPFCFCKRSLFRSSHVVSALLILLFLLSPLTLGTDFLFPKAHPSRSFHAGLSVTNFVFYIWSWIFVLVLERSLCSVSSKVGLSFLSLLRG